MLEIDVTDDWRRTFPGGHIGVLLVEGADNTRRKTPLDTYKKTVESQIREQFGRLSRADLLKLNRTSAYRKYYKAFSKTYHVQLQLESIAHKGKSLPRISPLVDANFTAEMKTLILTAGHDADRLEEPVRVDASRGHETLTQMNGNIKTLKPNDMMMCDAKGVVCSIIYGQDHRTPISPETRRALYVSYAPAGIPASAVSEQLEVRVAGRFPLFSPERFDSQYILSVVRHF